MARIIAKTAEADIHKLSAVSSGVKELRKVITQGEKNKDLGKVTILFIDEIHRFNRAQQDGFLPYVEDGTVILVGATTENPSFELNAPLLSRTQVLVLNRLDDGSLEELLVRAEKLEGRTLPLDADARTALRAMADGDGRYLLTMVESVLALPDAPLIDTAQLTEVVQRRVPLYDKSQEGHYNLISALHKSLRGSNTDAALYWLARMLAGLGESDSGRAHARDLLDAARADREQHPA